MRKRSNFILCMDAPEGGCGADVGRHGAMKPAGRGRERKGMMFIGALRLGYRIVRRE
jgi:hypothetical protein